LVLLSIRLCLHPISCRMMPDSILCFSFFALSLYISL
jgi:hypothetical protein